MINILIFFSIYFTVPTNNVNVFYKTTCENQKEYKLTSNFLTGETIIKNESNIIFNSNISSYDDNTEIRAFYCYENNLYAVIPEANGGDILANLVLYKLVNDRFRRVDSIDDVLATYALSSNNILIYYDWNNHYFYKVNLQSDLNNTEQLFHVTNYNSKEIKYLNNLNAIIYIDNNNNLILKKSNTEEVLNHGYTYQLYDIKKFNNKLYYIYKSSNSLMIRDENGHIYFEYNINDSETIKNTALFVNEQGIYTYVLFSGILKLIYIPQFNENNIITKEVDTNVTALFGFDKEISYSKNNMSSSDIYLIKANAGIPNKPMIDDAMIGVLSEIPASFSFSNFNQEFVYFLSYNFDISSSEDFNSVYYGGNISYYNKNASNQVHQFPDNLAFQWDTPYYMRIRYNGILASSEYNYIRFIISDLGEIRSFKIQNTNSDSTLYTNTEMVKASLEKIGKVEKIQLSLNENFKDNGKDILPINFESEFNFILPSEEKEYTYYVRPVIFDNNNFIGAHQIKIAKIILDKTAPIKPEFITENNSEFYKDNIEIKWQTSTDNLSGLKNYKLRLVNALNENLESIELENTKNNFIPKNSLSNGIYTFFISSCDNAENCSEENKLNFTIKDKENHKPYKPSLIRPKNREIIDSMPFNISWEKSIDPDDDELTYSLIIAKDINFDTKETEIYLMHKLSQNINYLAQGHYYLKLFAVDSKGAESEYEIIEFDVIKPKKSKDSSGCSFSD